MPTPARRAISSTPTSSPRSWKAARVAAMIRSRLRCASLRSGGFVVAGTTASVVRGRQPERTLRFIAIMDARRTGAHAPESDFSSAKDPMPQTASTDRYKWIALSNTTLGVLMATVNSSILLIALPDIFRGINIDPLAPGNTNYLLWMILSFLVVTAVLVVSLGRLGDVYGRVRMYNLGFAVFTAGSILLSVTWMTGAPAAIWMIAMRVVQRMGGAMLCTNCSRILPDASPANERGLALGINGVAAIAGSFIGLFVGGILAPIQWRVRVVVSGAVRLLVGVWGV